MDIKKGNFFEDRFELSSFSLKIYNVNAGNQTVTVVTLLWVLSAQARKPTKEPIRSAVILKKTLT